MQQKSTERLEQEKSRLIKKCWSSGTLSKRCVEKYVAFVMNHCTEDFITSDDVFYARIYLDMVNRHQKEYNRIRKYTPDYL